MGWRIHTSHQITLDYKGGLTMPVRSTQETQVDTTFKRSKNRTKSPAVSKVGTIFLAPHLNIFVGLFFQFGATNFLSRDFRVLSPRRVNFFPLKGQKSSPLIRGSGAAAGGCSSGRSGKSSARRKEEPAR